MTMVQNFEVISDTFNVDRICTCIICFPKNKIIMTTAAVITFCTIASSKGILTQVEFDL
jgi:hypothetical protein